MSFTKPDSYCTEKSTTCASSGLDDVEVFWVSNTTVPLLSFTLFPIRDVTFIRPPSILWITRKKNLKKYIYHHLHIMNNARNLNDVRKCSLVYIYRNSLKNKGKVCRYFTLFSSILISLWPPKVKLFIGCLSIWIFYRQVKLMFNVKSSTRGANLKGWRRIPEYFNAFCWHKV